MINGVRIYAHLSAGHTTEGAREGHRTEPVTEVEGLDGGFVRSVRSPSASPGIRTQDVMCPEGEAFDVGQSGVG